MTTIPQIRTLIMALALIIALSSLTTVGALSNANLSMVDQLFTTVPNEQDTPPILLVSTTEAQRANPSFLHDLIKKLNKDQPQSIYLLENYETLDQYNDEAHSWMENVISVKSISRLKHNYDLLQTAKQNPSGTVNHDSPPKTPQRNFAYMTEVSLKAGHYREWLPSQSLGEAQFLAFQILASLNNHSLSLQANDKLINSGAQIIDFSMEDGLLPLVSARRVLDEGLFVSLVKDKIILIGEEHAPGAPGFTVPTQPHAGISLLELQGYVLHSVISERLLSFSSSLITLAGILLIGILSILLFQWLPPQFSTIYSLIVCLLLVVLQWVSVKLNAQILPAWEWILTQIITLLAVYQLRRNKEEIALNRIIAETNSRLSQRVQPLNFNQSDDPWKKILSFVNQQLNLERSIFLEKIPQQHRLKEIEALNCSINDISEVRRDYHRAPYSDALDQNGPIIPFRKYFLNVEKNETEYLIPLTYSGDVMGFWALTLVPEDNWNQPIFENNLRMFSAQISELIFHRNHWKKHAEKSKNPWRRLFSLELGQSLHKQLSHSVTLLEHRLDTLEDVFNGLSTAAIVYDVFGQVLHTNSVIEYLAKINNIAVYRLTAMELLSLTGDMTLDDARKKLRYVTLKNQTLAINSYIFTSHSSHLLRIRPLLSPNKTNKEQINPFQILGILFEFIDISQIQQHIDVRHEVSDKYFLKLRNDLETINLANRRIEKNLNTDDKKLSKIIKETISEASILTERAENELLNHAYMSEQQIVPLNISPTITKIMADSNNSALEKEITFLYNPPELTSLSFVEPNTFEELTNSIFKLLINDAAHNSIINILIQDETDNDSHKTHINFTSMGKGIPYEQLEKALSVSNSYTDINDDPITKISILANQVRRWGGDVLIQTDIGSGFSIDVKLKTFDFSYIVKPNNKGADSEK